MLATLQDVIAYLGQTVGLVGDAFGKFSSPTVLAYVFGGTLLGITIGVMPGLTATMGVALLTTLTYRLEAEAALLVLVCLYVGAIYGGSRTAILLNIPGTPANAATTLDGYPLARMGRAGPAMGTATTGSFLGTLIGMVFLATIAPKLADYALEFQTHEFLWLAIFGVLISGQLTAMDDPLKGWIAGFLGLAIAMIGQEGLYMTDRFTFGFTEMQGGIGLIPAMVGAFGFSEVIAVMYNRRAEIVRASVRLLDVVPDPREVLRYWRTIGRSGVIGTLIGVIPGVGEDIGAWVSYAAARRASREKEKFGKGSVEGLMAAETGNSAAAPGALIPVITLGIPGSAPAAVLLAAMVLHGVRPGPMIMIEFPSFVYEVVVMMLLAAFAILVLGIALTPLLLKVLAIPRERLMPIVFVLCVIGSYAIQQRMFDVWVMVVFGIVGFVLREMKYPMAPLVLGIVLGDIFDKSFRRSWVIHDGDFTFYLNRPISLVLMLLCAATLIMSIGPCRRYLGPKVEGAVQGTIGVVTGLVRAHLVLVALLFAALAALVGLPVRGLEAGGAGFARGVRLAASAYAGILRDAATAFGRGLAGLVIAPLADLARFARRPGPPSADRGEQA
ncbi:MAG: tripartite tricarboxylate transporter permease [Xanthobacteraceae bacterium]|nr:tripartite tricarboxylate transporter permease [Xanthobacteraceae bacterium]PWB63431.1 MAG: transporter [Bradyrhizobiaceae bacterium]